MIDDVLFVFIYDDKGDCIQPKKGRNMVRHNLLTFLWGDFHLGPKKELFSLEMALNLSPRDFAQSHIGYTHVLGSSL